VGKRPKITTYPPELRQWLDAELVRRGFADYVQLAIDLIKQSEQLGKPVEASKSGLQRYGANLERKLEAIKASTHAAGMIAEAAPDDADLRSAAVISMIQTDTFETMVKLREADQEDDPARRMKLLSSAAANIAKLSRASVNQKKHELEIRSKVKSAADAAMRIAKKGGISKSGADELFRVITGIAST
jgi:hypothetical protein